MKTLTLTQPWASLVACGAKRIETRSWQTAYRGPLAIHAAKGFPAYAKDLAKCRKIVDLLTPHLGSKSEREYLIRMPFGSVVATCTLVDILPVESVGCLSGVFDDHPTLDTEQERYFGNYDPGRFGWVLENVKPLPSPDPCRGALSLWDWDAETYWQMREAYGHNGDATTPGFFRE